MRLFIAIDFDEIKANLSEIQSKIDTSLAKLNPSSAFHLTLKFLGEIGDDKVDLIKQKLSSVKFNQFQLTTSSIGVFPYEEFIKVIWLGVKPDEQVKELQNNIENELKEFNFKKDFDFHPHITLARVKFVKDKSGLNKNLKDIKIEPKTITVDNFRLVKSTLTQEGPVYEDVEIFKSV
ncbi:MAG: RNA 2',3'-cyclic phosphodiesterase [Nanoarchaeota archaeon]|nr:RNA 2',3'-cyclic phosphodiesterase [Nanoarchaeota archaeon]MBU1946562.1 RNA 2',3'-cyclic phosphodiesterase [Nanoarchaeota archaeon]